MNLIATLAFAAALVVNASAIHLTDLRCESLVHPIGIDTAVPRFSWRLVDPQATRGQRQTAWQIIANSGTSTLWDSGKIESSESMHIDYGGEQLRSNQPVRWKVRVWDMDGNPTPWSEEATFATGLLDPADWKGAWIAHPTAKQTEHVWFRKSFTLDDVPDYAFVHTASIGYHELYVNGTRIGSEVLAPSLTNLQKRVLYVTRDIAPHLRAGKNVVALWTGSGWARADGSYGKGVWMQDTLVKCQLDMSDGFSLHSDATWKCHVSSSSYRGLWKGGGEGEYGGEIIDARRHILDWNTPGFDDSAWPTAVTAKKEGIVLSAQMLEPDRIVETLKPVTITEANGNFIFDMGRNFTGWIELNLRDGSEGQVVRITTANRPGPLVEFDQESHYIHDASGKGTFRHRFNYQAGRWITIHNPGYRPEPDDLKGHIITNDVTRIGRFESSEPLFNAIYETDIRTFIANTVNGVTMDCPHRERFGYGEVQLACSWGCSIPHFLAASYWRHVSRNWADVQRDDGFINTIAPQTYNGAGGTLWNSALVTLNRESYHAYNDLRQLRDAYPAMKRWADFLHASVSEDGVLVPYDRVSRFLGDWATPHGSEYGDTPEAALFNNCVYAYNLITLVEAAHALGQPDDAKLYQQRLDALRKNAHRHFYDAENQRYIDGRQLAMAFPLYVGITPESEREAVMAGFIEEITARKPYLDTGSSGLPILLKFLVEHAGRADILADILARTEAPGYGHFLKNGATTWPEYWKGEDDNSHIHTCYTGISGVFTRAIGGIRPDPAHPGMKHFLIQPQLVGTLTHANTTAASYYGDIICNWSRTGTTATFDITVPPNTTATFHIPAADTNNVHESGKPVTQAEGVTPQGNQDSTQILHLRAGRYQFTTTNSPPPASQVKEKP
jgi:alpha-L-rhamnosidase